MNTTNQNQSGVPVPGENEGFEIKDIVSWLINAALKFAAGYLTKVIIDALGF